jgi:hypothetical protein
MLKKHIKTELPAFLQQLIGQLTNSSFDLLYTHLVSMISDLEFKVFSNVVEHLRRKNKASLRLKKRAQRRRARRPVEVEVDSTDDRSLRMTGPEVIQALGGPKARFSGQNRREARAPELKLSVDNNRDPDYRWIPEPWYKALQATGLPGSAYRKADVTKPYFKEDGPTMYGKSPGEFQRMALDHLVFSVPAKDRDKIHPKVNATLNEFAAEKAAEASSSKPKRVRKHSY